MIARYEDSAIQSALAVAVERLGYSSLRTQQELAIRSFVQGNDVFICLPTGSGKSLCYCILPAVFDSLRGVKSSIVVVVSPLIALMKDQVRAMTKKGVTAAFVGDCCSESEVSRVCEGSYQLVYMSPEALLTDDVWRDMLLSSLPLPHAHARYGKNTVWFTRLVRVSLSVCLFVRAQTHLYNV